MHVIGHLIDNLSYTYVWQFWWGGGGLSKHTSAIDSDKWISNTSYTISISSWASLDVFS